MKALLAAFSFLTRIPLPRVDDAGDDLGRSLPFFPVVGAALGGILVVTAVLLGTVIPAAPLAVAIVALHLLLTGGLHIDGVADLFDALGGGRGDRGRMLSIMRDSRIGAHGATAITVLIAAKICAIFELLHRESWEALIVAPMAARWLAVAAIAVFPYARQEGIGTPFTKHARRGLFGASLALLPALAILTPGAACGVAASAAAILLFAARLNRKLGGLTGDCYGALIEICETMTLFVLLARMP